MIFIENKYTRIYFAIITKATETIHPATTYTEKHHIIPKSLGGSNDTTNLVKLTAREHFICHWLLTKMTSDNAFNKMIYALRMMRCSGSKHTNRYNTKISSRVYSNLKKQYSIIHSKKLTGKKHSAAARVNMSIAQTGRVVSAETRAKISASTMGVPKSPRAAPPPVSNETRAKQSLAKQGIKRGPYKKLVK